MSKEHTWSRLGESEPYWAVCVEPRFRSDRMTPEDRRAFFESGDREMAATFDELRGFAGRDIRPARALDFGCGVGRLTMPLAHRSDQVVGADVSQPMLREAERNCAGGGLTNVSFVTTDQLLAEQGSGFDLIHSYIVFQHIPPADGFRITDALLRRLRPGGIAALHYTFIRRASALRRAVNLARRWLPPVDIAIKAMMGRPAFEPSILMYEYDAAELLLLFARHGLSHLGFKVLDHGGYVGAMMFLERPHAV